MNITGESHFGEGQSFVARGWQEVKSFGSIVWRKGKASISTVQQEIKLLWSKAQQEGKFFCATSWQESRVTCGKFRKIGFIKLFFDRATSDIKGHEKLCKFNIALVRAASLVSDVAEQNLKLLLGALEAQKDLMYMTGIVSSLADLFKHIKEVREKEKNKSDETKANTEEKETPISKEASWKERITHWVDRKIRWGKRRAERAKQTAKDLSKYIKGDVWTEKTSSILYLIGNACDSVRLVYKYGLCQSPLLMPLTLKLGQYEIGGIRPFALRHLGLFASNNPKDVCVFMASLIDCSYNCYKYLRPSGKDDAEKVANRRKLLRTENLCKQAGNIGKMILITANAWTDKLTGSWKYRAKLAIAGVDIATQLFALCIPAIKATDLYDLEEKV